MWDEKTSDKLVAHNIYSEWHVLIEEDPNVSFEKEGQVYGKLGRTVEMLDQSRVRSIFNPDSPSWENVKIESKGDSTKRKISALLIGYSPDEVEDILHIIRTLMS